VSPPKKIRIEDLRNPVLNDIQKAALAHGESNPVDLSIAAVLDAAEERTGLSDLGDNFGEHGFRERLGLWLSEVDEDSARSS